MPPSIRVLATAVWAILGCSDPPNAAYVRVTPATAVVPLGTNLQLDAVALDGVGNAILGARFIWSIAGSNAQVNKIDRPRIVGG